MQTRLAAGLLAAALAGTAGAAPPSTCHLPGGYEQALCAYQRRAFAQAEAGFRAIVEREEQNPQTVRALYFLARTLMKTGRWEEAGRLLVQIYEADRPFYDGWNCDFLLGECRRAQGKG